LKKNVPLFIDDSATERGIMMVEMEDILVTKGWALVLRVELGRGKDDALVGERKLSIDPVA
jgi:hypothetical protein